MYREFISVTGTVNELFKTTHFILFTFYCYLLSGCFRHCKHCFVKQFVLCNEHYSTRVKRNVMDSGNCLSYLSLFLINNLLVFFFFYSVNYNFFLFNPEICKPQQKERLMFQYLIPSCSFSVHARKETFYIK